MINAAIIQANGLLAVVTFALGLGWVRCSRYAAAALVVVTVGLDIGIASGARVIAAKLFDLTRYRIGTVAWHAAVALLVVAACVRPRPPRPAAD